MIVIQKCGRDGIKFTRFRRCTLGSKVCKGSPVQEAPEETVGFGGGKLFLMVRIFSVKSSEKTVGRSSESKAEGSGEEKFLPSMELKF